MVVLPAGFARCRNCERLLVVDNLNIAGRCVPECGRYSHGGTTTAVPAWMGALSVAHFCPSVASGNPEDCAFGNVGCRG